MGGIAVTRAPRTRTIVLACMAVLAVFAGAFVWVGVRAYLAKGELEALIPIARDIAVAAEARDLERLDDLMGPFRDHASAAASLTGDPLWGLAEAMPVLGPNFAAVQSVSHHLDAISRGVRPLLELASESNEIGFDVARLERAREPLVETADAVAAAEADFAMIRAESLVAPLGEGVTALAGLVSEAGPPLAVLSDAVQVLPDMLGADGPRTILLMMQNPAEPRTGGGITGSFALLEAVDGELTLALQADSGAFVGGSEEAVAPVPDSTVTLYGDTVGRFVMNASMPADFTVTADLARAWWLQQSDVVPDAVISIDPEVLAAMVSATGPITLSNGLELNGDNLVQTLLVDAYFVLDRDDQTQFQQLVTATAFSQLLSGSIDFVPFAEALAPVIAEGRISMWSADPDEEAVIAEGPFSGPAGRQRMAGDDAYAVYVNDATGGKMGSFLFSEVGASTVQCRSDGRPDTVVVVRLANNAPDDAGATFPWWVSGGGIEGTTPGHIAASITVAAPPDSFFGGVVIGDETLPSTDVVDAGFPSSLVHVDLAPGESTSVEFRFVAPDAVGHDPVIVTTPLLNMPIIDKEFSAGCAG